MEGRNRILLLNRRDNQRRHWLLAAFVCISAVPYAAAQDSDAPVREEQEQVIRPEIDRREIQEVEIDTEDFETGVYAGIMSVEDFGTNAVAGVRAAYHVTEDVFVEAALGRTNTGKTSFERLSGGAQLINDRELMYYNVSLAYNLFPGEAFLGRRHAVSTSLFVIGGLGVTDFADDKQFTWNIGAGYRFLATDWIAVRFDVRDHIFETDLLGSEKYTHNIEIVGGITFFF